MKKFIAPEVKVVRYDSSILCESMPMGGDITGEVDLDAPRRRSIFEDTDMTEKSSRMK